MKENPRLFSTLTEELCVRTARAYISHLTPVSTGIRQFLAHHLERPAGVDGSFLADPVIEATFGWEPCTPRITMQDLAGELLHPKLVDAMDRDSPARFGANWAPHRHQERAWRVLAKPEVHSVLVSSGTGSGKTECFLVPILDRLVRLAEGRTDSLSGVRAIFLYPLNALIASQRERLSSWLEPFGGKIRYCLYNGDTPEQPPRNRAAPAQEVSCRKHLREDPPPMVVTNATMLEYMLVRAKDAPIIAKSRGKLEYIVLDEAHTYGGSQAAELALLLRRLMHAFEVEPSNVRLIATSATIANDNGESTQAELKEYVANLAGLPASQVVVIEGRRKASELAPAHGQATMPLPALEELATLSAAERYQQLAASPEVRRIRQRLINEGPTKLSDLSRVLHERASDEAMTAEEQTRTLELLDGICLAVHDDKPLLPLRGHFFQRVQPGLWACANGQCGCRDSMLRDDSDWIFGQIYLERRSRCECGAVVFPIVICGRCGIDYLGAEEVADAKGYRVEPRIFGHDDRHDADGLDDDEPELDERIYPGQPLLIARPDRRAKDPFPRRILNPMVANLDGEQERGVEVSPLAPHPKHHRLVCVRCGERERRAGALFRAPNVGAPFVLGVSIPALLELAKMHEGEGAPPGKEMTDDGVLVDLPGGGRRTITFTDSRQGTARFSLKMDTQGERNFVRAWILKRLRAELPDAETTTKRAALEAEIAERWAKVQQMPEEFRHMVVDGIRPLESQLKQLAQPSAISWLNLQDGLSAHINVQHWGMKAWRDRAGVEDPADLAQFLLFRELARRPPRATSLETLGLARVQYPDLTRRVGESDVPQLLGARGGSFADWRDFLEILMDFVIRSNSAVKVRSFHATEDGALRFDYFRWMGTQIRPKSILGPDTNESGDRKTLLWPQARKRQVGAQHRMVRLLARGLEFDLTRESDRADINAIFAQAWACIRPLLVRQSGGRGQCLELHKHVEVSLLDHGYVCPVTRRLLGTTFRGITPYLQLALSNDDVKCERVTLPRPPLVEQSDEFRRWLEEDLMVLRLRRLGLWTEHSDRIVTGATSDPFYFQVAEHSGHIDGTKLRRREDAFKAGHINVLSCSTTMEMGVDIGGLSSVAMNNAPPSPSNYLQRAGRAGRRNETAATVLTLCRATPHGEAVFANPLWPFETQIQVPRVSLSSERIIQRHVNALCLRHYLLSLDVASALHLTAGWLFEPPSALGTPARWQQFVEWVTTSRSSHLDAGLRSLVHSSALGGLSPAELARRSAGALGRVRARWFAEYEGLVAGLEDVGGPLETFKGAERAQIALTLQLDRFLDEYLLGELAQRGFLPGYGFPTQIVPFVYTTMEDIKREKRLEVLKKDGLRKRGRSSRKYPTRELPLAIREYAPGNAVVIDGKVYESRGLTLNWKIPAQDKGGAQETQRFRYAWRCRECLLAGTDATPTTECEGCGKQNIRNIKFIQPAGFATQISYQAHNDATRARFIPIMEPWIRAGDADWVNMSEPTYGRTRYSGEGTIFHHSRGELGFGYALCLKCGFAASETESQKAGAPTDLPRTYSHHRRLRGRKDAGEAECPGNEYGLVRGLNLGAELETDVFEVQLLDPATGLGLDHALAATLAVALRHGLCAELGIDDSEVGWAVTHTRLGSDELVPAIALYDTAVGGAGFVARARGLLKQVLERGRDLLNCPRECDAACHACLLSYDTQHDITLLSRTRGCELLNQTYLDGLALPPHAHIFGEGTRFEHEELATALTRERASRGGRCLHLYLDGDPVNWDFGIWDLRRRLSEWTVSTEVVLCLPTGARARMTPMLSLSLAALLELDGSLCAIELSGIPSIEGLVAELETQDGVTRWGVVGAPGVVPGQANGADVGTRVAKRFKGAQLGALDGEVLRVEALRPSGDFARIAVEESMCEVSITQISAGIWDMIFDKAVFLKSRFDAGFSLSEIKYADRYLHSPLVGRILVDFLGEFLERAKQAGCLPSETKLSVWTEPTRGAKRQKKRVVYADWASSSIRDAVFTVALAQVAGNCGVTSVDFSGTKTREEVGHARGLTVTFENGDEWALHLDHGFGFLTTVDSNQEFEHEAPVDGQVLRLREEVYELTMKEAGPAWLFAQAKAANLG